MSRASAKCEITSSGLTYVQLESQKVRRENGGKMAFEQIMDKNFPNLGENNNILIKKSS